MTARPIPARHWRSYGDDPLPSGVEALDELFAAFPSWFLRIECDRCGKVSMLNEAHTTGRRREMPLRDLLTRMRHDGCGGRPGRAERLCCGSCSVLHSYFAARLMTKRKESLKYATNSVSIDPDRFPGDLLRRGVRGVAHDRTGQPNLRYLDRKPVSD